MFISLIVIVNTLFIPPVPQGENGKNSPSIPRLRDAQGDLLPEGAIARLGSNRWRLANSSQSLLFTHNGQYLMSSGTALEQFDAKTGKNLTLSQIGFPGMGFSGNHVAASLDDRYVFTALDGPGYLLQFDMRTRKARNLLSQDNSQPRNSFMELSGNGKIGLKMELLNAPNGAGGRIEVSKITVGPPLKIQKLEQRLLWNGNVLRSLSYSGRFAAMVETRDQGFETFTNDFVFWDLETNRRLRYAVHNCHSEPLHFFFTPDEESLVVRYPEGFQVIANPHRDPAGRGRVIVRKQLDTRLDANNGTNLVPIAMIDNKQICFVDLSGALCLSEFPSFKPIWKQWNTNGSGNVSCMTFTPDRKKIAFATELGRVIRFLDRATGRELIDPGHTETISSLKFHPTLPLLVSAASQNLRIWSWRPKSHFAEERESGSNPYTFRTHSNLNLHPRQSQQPYGGINAFNFIDGGNRLAAITTENQIIDYDLRSGRRLNTRQFPAENTGAIVLSADGQAAVLQDFVNRKISVLRGDSAKLLDVEMSRVNFRDFSFSNDGKIIACLLQPNTLLYFDAETGKRIPAEKRPGAAFSKECRFLNNLNNTLFNNEIAARLIDLQSSRTWNPVVPSLQCAAFTRDGRYCLSIDAGEQKIQMTEIVTGKIVRSWLYSRPGENTSVNDCEFSGDSRFFATALESGVILLWDIDPQSPRYRTPAPANFDQMYQAMKGKDATRWYAALGFALNQPAETLQYFKTHFKPHPGPDAVRVAQWHNQLKDRKYRLRQEAYAELVKLTPILPGWLEKKLQESRDLDEREWLKQMQEQPIFPRQANDEILAVRLVECVEKIGTPEAWEYLRELAKGADWSGLMARLALERQN
ncbi:WD40 repeat domain-containing protein [Telmatocola sphagniphila]|uniref:WD40 repeat domain-containing protein n=1 Tax=Telmatocola sphagniphila TaxID=1123043 RepID=A0A8E6B3K1_9BACT|nr:WD40 repeat domain-containing protein [Telmatocola sphagniphila]QVL30692.1 WD40 repeat domain-containing protein [Telmatocola sphagniphila]